MWYYGRVATAACALSTQIYFPLKKLSSDLSHHQKEETGWQSQSSWTMKVVNSWKQAQLADGVTVFLATFVITHHVFSSWSLSALFLTLSTCAVLMVYTPMWHTNTLEDVMCLFSKSITQWSTGPPPHTTCANSSSPVGGSLTSVSKTHILNDFIFKISSNHLVEKDEPVCELCVISFKTTWLCVNFMHGFSVNSMVLTASFMISLALWFRAPELFLYNTGSFL